LRSYECIVIFRPTVSEEGLKLGTSKFAGVIAGQGGEITLLETWGKRRLAYEIEDHFEGHYFLYKFRGENKLLNELGRQMRIDESVIRHMVCVDELAKGDEAKVEPDKLEAKVREVEPEEERPHREHRERDDRGRRRGGRSWRG
jgi:small subunit ribosomal protein S6